VDRVLKWSLSARKKQNRRTETRKQD